MQKEKLPVASASYSAQERAYGGKPKGLIWPLCDMAGAFVVGWDGYTPEQKGSLRFSLQSQKSYQQVETAILFS